VGCGASGLRARLGGRGKEGKRNVFSSILQKQSNKGIQI
jgi:hypothetical protein